MDKIAARKVGVLSIPTLTKRTLVFSRLEGVLITGKTLNSN